jgi:hypothetical protein
MTRKLNSVRLASRMSRGRRQSMARKASARPVCVVAGTVKKAWRGAASMSCTLERGGESRLSINFFAVDASALRRTRSGSCKLWHHESRPGGPRQCTKTYQNVHSPPLALNQGGTPLNIREACEDIMGEKLASNIIADPKLGLHWCVVAAMADERNANRPRACRVISDWLAEQKSARSSVEGENG